MEEQLPVEVPKKKSKKKEKHTESQSNEGSQLSGSTKKLKNKKKKSKEADDTNKSEASTVKSSKRQKIDEVDEIEEEQTADKTVDIQKQNQAKEEESEEIKKDWVQGPDMAPNGALLPEVDIDAFPEGEDGVDWLRKYSLAVGFVIKIDRSWTGYKKWICNRNSKQLASEIKEDADKKQCPWVAIFKRDHDNMWRFKQITNYHNHNISGTISKWNENVEVIKSLPNDVKKKIDTMFFELGKSKREIISEFKTNDVTDTTQIDKNERKNEETKKDNEVADDLVKENKEVTKTEEKNKEVNIEEKDTIKIETSKNKSEPPLRVSLLNNYMVSYIFPKEENFTEFWNYLKSQYENSQVNGFVSVHYNNQSCVFSIWKKDMLELYSDIIYIDSDFDSDSSKISNHKSILTFLGVNEHGSLIPLFIWILNDLKLKTVTWAISEITNIALKGRKPKMFILDMDYHLFLSLMNIYEAKHNYELNYVYDAYQVSKRLFNSLFQINNSKYKSGEIWKEFMKGWISSDKSEYMKVINRLYATYANIFPKIKELLTILMRNRNRIAHAHLGEYSFTKNVFWENAKLLWNVIKRSPLRNQSYKDILNTINYFITSMKQTPVGIDYVDYIKSGMTHHVEEGQKKQYKYMLSPFSISILDEIIQVSADTWRWKKTSPNQYKWLKVEWIEENRNRISEFNTWKYYEDKKWINLRVSKTEIFCDWLERDSIPNLPWVHIIAVFIYEKVNIKQYLQFVSGKRWENTRSDVGRKRKLAEELPFYSVQEWNFYTDQNIPPEQIIWT